MTASHAIKRYLKRPLLSVGAINGSLIQRWLNPGGSTSETPVLLRKST
jgi:hypothetical protein